MKTSPEGLSPISLGILKKKPLVAFKKTLLSSGIRVLTESHPHSRCVSLGFWFQGGARREGPHQMGLSHLLEHMVFKGTEKYSAFDLARCLESVGGDLNAFTAKEHICFHTTSLEEHLDLSVDVLCQLVAFPRLDEWDLIREKKVIQQEILMASDDLEETIHDLYMAKVFPENSLGYPILGSSASLEAFTLEDLRSYFETHFQPQDLVVTAVGSLEHGFLVECLEKYLKNKNWSLPSKSFCKTAREESGDTSYPPPQPLCVHHLASRDSEQHHIILGFSACGYRDKDRFSGFVFNGALGGGMTSRLYQSIREERGLVYSIFSTLSSFVDCGLQSIYAGTQRKSVEEVVKRVQKELEIFLEKGLSLEDVEFYKTQAKGQILIGSEDIENRMHSLAVNEMVLGQYRSVEQVLMDLDQVTEESVQNYIQERYNPSQLSLCILGVEDRRLRNFVTSFGAS